MSDERGISSSPCVRNCCLTDHDICVGCGRSLPEILEWSRADPPRRRVVLRLAEERLAVLARDRR
ncbi:MAG: DUF1289 domain-containing protein [Proteobacteria bacterium]|nr:DUF1289 domain-containing protein [Pseudomonadota bacterium]